MSDIIIPNINVQNNFLDVLNHVADVIVVDMNIRNQKEVNAVAVIRNKY